MAASGDACIADQLGLSVTLAHVARIRRLVPGLSRSPPGERPSRRDSDPFMSADPEDQNSDKSLLATHDFARTHFSCFIEHQRRTSRPLVFVK